MLGENFLIIWYNFFITFKLYNFITKLLAILKKHQTTIKAIFLSFIVLAYLSWLNLNPTLKDPDAFYHAKMGLLMSEQGIITDFPWMQFTTLKDHFADHHLLYHAALVPFIKIIGDPLWALKTANIIFCTLVILTIYWLMVKFKAKYPLAFIALLLVNNPFIFRISLNKAQPFALIIIFLTFWALHKKNLWLLFILGFLHVWAHGSWPIFLAITLIWIFSDYLVRFANLDWYLWHWRIIKRTFKTTWRENKHLKILLAVISGLAAGLVINPYFPNNLYFYWQQIVQVALINYKDIIQVGSEWYPYGVGALLNNLSLISLVALLGTFIFIFSYKKQSAQNWALGLTTIMFVILTLKSRRNVEFLAPLAIVWLSTIWAIGLKSNLPQKLLIYLKPQMKKYQLFTWTFVIYIAVAAALTITKDVSNLKSDLGNGRSFNSLTNVSVWLKLKTPPGSVVFNDNWSDFPNLFYNNSSNYYIGGLDPTFTYNYNKDIYWHWVNITLGTEKENIPQTIKNDFNSQYILLTSGHDAFKNNLENSIGIKKVYQDLEATIYRISQ